MVYIIFFLIHHAPKDLCISQGVYIHFLLFFVSLYPYKISPVFVNVDK